MRGTRLVAGFPQLPPGLIGIRADAPTGDEAARFSVADAASLTDIDPFLTVDVEEAVRMSANFPWGFDLPTVGIEGRGRAVRVVDGGVLDNTGIDTIYQLLLGLERISDERQSAGLRPSLRTRATALMDELASRGVVLLEIDSGAKPEQPGMVTKALSNVLLPVHSLSMSGFVRASETTSSYIEVMEQLLTRHAARRLRAARPDSEREDRLPDGALVGRRFDHVVYVLNTEGLMTSWGLAPTQKGELVARFLAEDASQRLALRDAIEAIEGANQAACLLARTRAGGPVLTRLFTGIYDEWDDLGRLERATMDDEDEQRRQTYDVALGDADPKGGIPPNTRPLRGWYPIGLFQPQFAPAPVGETDADTTGTPSLVPSTQCGGTPGHLGPGHWLLSRVDAARDLAPGDLVGHRFELLRPALLREAPPDSEGRLGKEIAGGIYPRGSSFEVLSVQQFGSTGIWFAEAAFGRAAATHTP